MNATHPMNAVHQESSVMDALSTPATTHPPITNPRRIATAEVLLLAAVWVAVLARLSMN